jgi:hypothetical protein
MRKVIEGKVYDTTTAEYICDVTPTSGMSQSDFRWEDTDLYRTKKGTFFIAGKGGPLTRWAERTGNNGRTGGSGLVIVDDTTARSMVEQFADEATYNSTFGEPEEG